MPEGLLEEGLLECLTVFTCFYSIYIYIHMESARKWFQRAMHDWIVFWPSTKKGGGLWVELLEYPAGWVANFLMSRRSSEGVAGRHGFAADLALTHKQPAGPETVPIKRTFLKNMWFYHSAVLIWWLEILEKLGARFLAFQRHRCNACTVISWQSAFLWMHLHCQALAYTIKRSLLALKLLGIDFFIRFHFQQRSNM